jgi:hypothetical protein
LAAERINGVWELDEGILGFAIILPGVIIEFFLEDSVGALTRMAPPNREDLRELESCLEELGLEVGPQRVARPVFISSWGGISSERMLCMEKGSISKGMSSA